MTGAIIAICVEVGSPELLDEWMRAGWMPNLDGLDATRAIRALPGHIRTPILAMTANAFAEDRQRCIAAGMNDHIPTPVNPDKLFEMLLKWLTRA